LSVVDGARPRVVAFYLPQYHPIPENDQWWGRGFTEWTTVTKARPLFPGHYQPHLPADLGFYDLRLPEARAAQAAVARACGIDAFCYYHYWFGGKRLLERPFQEVLASGEPDLPFCLCWANENWTRRWDGLDDDVLMRQEYSPEDDRAHFLWLAQAFKDSRYFTVNGKPLFLVYSVTSLPHPTETVARWRQLAEEAGLPGLFLCTVRSKPVDHVDPRRVGFDAAVDFQPDRRNLPPRRKPLWRRLLHHITGRDVYCLNKIIPYASTVDAMLGRPEVPYPLFPGVTPGWDNSARRQGKSQRALILDGSTPELYGRWLRAALQRSAALFRGGERLVFVNAWNEWAEGNHLEPDLRWGRAYLEETRKAIEWATQGLAT